MKNVFLSLFLLCGFIFAQESVKYQIGVFPHYAIGNEWNTTLYLEVVGGQECTYTVDFMNTSGTVLHTYSFSPMTEKPLDYKTIRYNVPAFASGLTHGPVIIYGNKNPIQVPYDGYNPDVNMEYRKMVNFVPCGVRGGELVFSAKYPNQKYDGSISFSRLMLSYPKLLLDGTSFQYGAAMYNDETTEKIINYILYDENGKLVKPETLLVRLAPKEQKIFVLNDLVPEMAGKLVTLQIMTRPSLYFYSTFLKFNSDRGFSTVEAY